MPVVRRPAGATAGGVYAAVRERIEADARLHAERVAGWSSGEHPHPLQRVLDALRAGKPTDVPAWAVPSAAHCRETAMFYAAIVRPNDTVTFDVEDGALLWLEYQGL